MELALHLFVTVFERFNRLFNQTCESEVSHFKNDAKRTVSELFSFLQVKVCGLRLHFMI